MSAKLASDLDNPEFVGARNPDDGLWVQFDSRKELMGKKSEEAGHPVYEMRDYVTIRVPGDTLNVVVRPVTPSDKARFPRQWAHYQNTRESGAVDGWALEEWPMVNAAQVEELKYRKCFTVEQLAGMPDGIAQSLGMGYLDLKHKAITALRRASEGTDELKQRDEIIQKQAEALAAMEERLAKLEASRPGRRPKQEGESKAEAE